LQPGSREIIFFKAIASPSPLDLQFVVQEPLPKPGADERSWNSYFEHNTTSDLGQFESALVAVEVYDPEVSDWVN
jgi:hypothetical protein